MKTFEGAPVMHSFHTVLHLWRGGADVGQQKMIVQFAVVCVKIWVHILFFNHCILQPLSMPKLALLGVYFANKGVID